MNDAATAATAVRRIGAFVADAPRSHGCLALERHSCCGYAHRAVDAALRLRAH